MATYKIAIDTLGSDKGPETIVQGALMALAENPEGWALMTTRLPCFLCESHRDPMSCVVVKCF